MQPPKRAINFLRWFCREDYIEEIEGDLTELFTKQSQQAPRKARWLFAWRVLKYFRPDFIKSFKYSHSTNPFDMLQNYIKVAMRHLIRNSGYSFINIGGLALGLTITMLIGLWVHDELSFDTYHKNYKNIGQLWAGGTDPSTQKIEGSVSLQLPMAAILKNDYHQYFKHILLAWWVGEYTLSTDDVKLVKMGEMIEADAPEMLSLKMLKGSYASLKDPHSIILSASTARSMFGDDDPINKTMKINNQLEVKVTGIYDDIPKNNRFGEVQFFAPWDLWYSSNRWISENETNWGNRSYNIYVELARGVTIEKANDVLHDFYYKSAPKELKPDVEKYKAFIQVLPMSTWHLYAELRDGKPAAGRITFVWLFGIIGAFVLLLACINFINLSTARSEKRAREVGVRKSVGSGRGQLVFQFLSESFLIVVAAFIVSIVLLVFSMDAFNSLADKDIALPFQHPIFWLAMIAFLVVTGLMAGLYPAFYLSSFKPAKVLKGVMRSGRFSSAPRKVLVVLQFTVSVMLIIGTIVVYQQVQHARNRPVGYDRDGLVSVRLNDPNFNGRHDAIRNELMNTGAVTQVAYSSGPLTDTWNNVGDYVWKGRDMEQDNGFGVMNVTYDFGKTVGWQFIAGRDFSSDFASDTAAVVINETAAKYMELPNPVDEILTNQHTPGRWKIIGVIKDMIMDSPYEPVSPALFFLDRRYYSANHLQVKLTPSVGTVEALAKIEATIKKIVPSAAFDFKFVDQEYALKFAQEQRIGKLAGVFAILAIFISCMGLFGLASFVTEQRTKEIGIRKVLGATVSNLWQMLSRDFVILVTVSCFVAIPISYYVMKSWLHNYKYHVEIAWWVFPVTIGGCLMVTLLTVSFQAVKAALMNPVNSLRSE